VSTTAGNPADTLAATPILQPAAAPEESQHVRRATATRPGPRPGGIRQAITTTPRGLPGRVIDALDDAELIAADPVTYDQAITNITTILSAHLISKGTAI
jgi:hypothetical protein